MDTQDDRRPEETARQRGRVDAGAKSSVIHFLTRMPRVRCSCRAMHHHPHQARHQPEALHHGPVLLHGILRGSCHCRWATAVGTWCANATCPENSTPTHNPRPVVQEEILNGGTLSSVVLVAVYGSRMLLLLLLLLLLFVCICL